MTRIHIIFLAFSLLGLTSCNDAIMDPEQDSPNNATPNTEQVFEADNDDPVSSSTFSAPKLNGLPIGVAAGMAYQVSDSELDRLANAFCNENLSGNQGAISRTMSTVTSRGAYMEYEDKTPPFYERTGAYKELSQITCYK